MEVYYIFCRRGGVNAAEDALQDLLDAGITPHDDLDLTFWKEAAVLKATHPVALPDAFCIALARRLDGTAVTSDHNEFDPLVPLNLCPIRFIR
jgi:predicted nucleic acid-binding protein